MAIQSVQLLSDHPDGDIVHVFGEPTDVGPCMRMPKADAVLIAGYVVGLAAEAEHDGKPAKRFTLEVDNGTEVGRLIVRTDVPTEYTFEFDVLFFSPEDASEWVDWVRAPKPAPLKVAKVEGLDFSYDGDLLEEMAKMSAKHGVSMSVTDPEGPGGGWPVVSISGLTANVKACLMASDYGWDYSEVEADEMMREATVTV